jgi:hypothetical protein
MSAFGGKADIRWQQQNQYRAPTCLHDLYELYAFQPRVSVFE